MPSGTAVATRSPGCESSFQDDGSALILERALSPELLLGALLAAAAVVFVAIPFLRAKDPPSRSTPADATLAAAEERDRVLAELKELEFDHRTGKITDEDYGAQIGPLRERAAALLSAGTAKEPPEQRFSSPSAPSSRRDR